MLQQASTPLERPRSYPLGPCKQASDPLSWLARQEVSANWRKCPDHRCGRCNRADLYVHWTAFWTSFSSVPGMCEWIQQVWESTTCHDNMWVEYTTIEKAVYLHKLKRILHHSYPSCTRNIHCQRRDGPDYKHSLPTLIPGTSSSTQLLEGILPGWSPVAPEKQASDRCQRHVVFVSHWNLKYLAEV